MRNESSIRLVFSAVFATFGVAAVAGEVTFHKVADWNDAVPGHDGGFTGFDPLSISVSGAAVAFIGASDGGGHRGIYRADGGTLSVVVDSNTSIPGGAGKFIGFSELTFSGEAMAFQGIGSGGQRGIYSNAPGALVAVADMNTPVPGSSAGTNFSVFGQMSSSLDAVVFRGGTGFYKWAPSSELVAVADKTALIPGTDQNFVRFGTHPAVSASGTVFPAGGIGSMTGIYVARSDGSFATLANEKTGIPGGQGNFTFFSNPAISGNQVAFLGGGIGQKGIYAITLGGSPPMLVADASTQVPNSGALFGSFERASPSGNRVAFLGRDDSATEGIYLFDGATLSAVVVANSMLDGKRITRLSMGYESFDGDRLAFWVKFDDDTTAIYRVDLGSAEPMGKPRISSIRRTATGFRLGVSGAEGQELAIEYSPSLGARSWQPIADVTIESNGRTEFEDEDPARTESRILFYRATVRE